VLDAGVVPRVVVITDSTAGVSGVPAHVDLRIVPVTLLFTDGEACDLDLDPAEVYARLARHEAVKSQAPSPATYLEAIEAGDHDGAIVLTPADEFTVMAHHARLAAELAMRPTVVVDTRTAAAGNGLVVRAAAVAAAQGASLEQVSAAAQDAAARVELIAAMYDASHVERSGHFHPDEPQRAGGAMIARFRDGQVVPLATARDPVRTLASAWRHGGGESGTTTVFHTARPRPAERLRRDVAATEPVLTCGAAMGAHVGPDLVGIAWLRS